MSDSYSHTTFEKGTRLYHALRESGPGHHFQRKLLFAIPIEEDPTEAWLDTYPSELKVSREAAQDALAQVADAEEQLTQKLRQRRMLETCGRFLAEVGRLEREIEMQEREYLREIASMLGHDPTPEELQDLLELHRSAENEKEAHRKANPNKLAEIMRQKMRDSPNFEKEIEELARERRLNPPEPSRADRDAKEHAEYRRYRELINRLERKHR